MDAIDAILEDLDWRQAEFGAAKILLGTTVTKTQEEFLLRAAWSLLYAHYEGFVKRSLDYYYAHLSSIIPSCRDLPQSMKLFAMAAHIKKIRNAANNGFLDVVENFCNSDMASPPVFPKVDAKSNLHLDILTEFLDVAGIDRNVIYKKNETLKILVDRRNDIVHGDRELVASIDAYLSTEKVVYDLMFDLAIAIEERIKYYKAMFQ